MRETDTEAWLNLIAEKERVGVGNTKLRATAEHVLSNARTVDGVTTVTIRHSIVELLDEGGPAFEAGNRLMNKSHDK